MKRDVNDASFEPDYGISYFSGVNFMSSRISVYLTRPADAHPSLLTWLRAFFRTRDEVRYVSPRETTNSWTYSWVCMPAHTL